MIKQLYDNIDDYLANPDIKINQEKNRETLLQNVMEFLPKYANVD